VSLREFYITLSVFFFFTTNYYLRDMAITANCMYVLSGRGVALVAAPNQLFSGRIGCDVE
jgi:hypothetical protein